VRLRVAGYLIERPLASGASGVVFRAVDERLGRHVALKVLKQTALPQGRERFLREVRAIEGLQHPNLVLLYGAGDDNGVAWAAMEMMPASLSQELLRIGRFTGDQLRAVTRDACNGLLAAWQRGIVHRDIKPSNLMRSADGVVKVVDFGLARDLANELHLAEPERILGTPWYLSPEHARGENGGVAADLYSLGATLYHLAAGRPPFESSNALDVIVRHAIEAPPPLPDDVPESMARLIFWLLEKNPADRPCRYESVLAALDRAALDVGAAAVGDSERDLSVSIVSAARAALQIGRGKRVRSLLEPLVHARGPGWIRAAFLLAPALQESKAPEDARAVLESIVAHADTSAQRALALWNLGRMAEKESPAALERAIDTYSRILAAPPPRFPAALLEARIAKLRSRLTPPA
jgi:serine/threonine protein kinase